MSKNLISQIEYNAISKKSKDDRHVYSITQEVKLLLNRAGLLCYEKQLSYVIGNGKSTFFELLQENISHNPKLFEAALTSLAFPLTEGS